MALCARNVSNIREKKENKNYREGIVQRQVDTLTTQSSLTRHRKKKFKYDMLLKEETYMEGN